MDFRNPSKIPIGNLFMILIVNSLRIPIGISLRESLKNSDCKSFEDSDPFKIPNPRILRLGILRGLRF